MNSLIKPNRGWTRYVIIFLGLWLIATAFSFDSGSKAMAISDVVSGLILIFVICRHKHTLVGIWLQLAPLVFWAPNSVSYLNDTLVGVAVIVFSLLLPPEEEKPGAEIPPGWSYNPSSWPQRIPIVFLAFFAWMFARYMASYQLGYLSHIVGEGTLKVITSDISKSFPVADAGLGAVAYTLEALMAVHGSVKRWHTIPWFVVLFAVLVVPVGFVSILLIMLQPILVGYWCFWCLLTALCMLFMIALSLDEVVAVWQYLRGGSSEGEKMVRADSPFYGIGFPWNLWITAVAGIWLMFSPEYLGETGVPADLDHILGALAVTFSIISMAEVARSLRFLNIVLGIGVLALAFFAQGASHVVAGGILILLSLPKGRIYERYGNWDRYIR